MKTIRILKRTVTERTGYKKYPFKAVTQYTIVYNNKETKNHLEDTNNQRLKVKFEEVVNTRSTKVIKDFMAKLSRTNDDKWLYDELNKICK